MKGAGRVGWLLGPSTRTSPSNVTVPVAVAARWTRLLPGPFTVVSTGPTPVQVTSKVTSCVPPRLSRAIPLPVTVTLLRLGVFVIVAWAEGAAQLNELPSGHTKPLPLIQRPQDRGPGARWAPCTQAVISRLPQAIGRWS